MHMRPRNPPSEPLTAPTTATAPDSSVTTASADRSLIGEPISRIRTARRRFISCGYLNEATGTERNGGFPQDAARHVPASAQERAFQGWISDRCGRSTDRASRRLPGTDGYPSCTSPSALSSKSVTPSVSAPWRR